MLQLQCMLSKVAVLCLTENKKLTDQVSEKWSLPAITSMEEAEPYTHFLFYNKNILNLGTVASAKTSVHIDFSSWYRKLNSSQGFSKKSLLAKSIGAGKLSGGLVWDLTAGLCKDNFVFLGLGCRVTAIEKSSIICALIEDGIRRGREDVKIREWIERLTVVNDDAFNFLQENQNERPHAIYIDPMYPEKKKAALPKKDMQVLQTMSPPTGEAEIERWLNLSLELAQGRVVVKRPTWSEAIPSKEGIVHSYESKSVRFDMYQVRSRI